MTIDPRHMARAIELARPHRPHPNPRVGAVIVDPSGHVIGEGAHTGPGHPHAEIVALAAAGEAARGATIYTTLEPCTVDGRTPPCVAALVEAGVARVVVGAIDPDTRVSGGGVEALVAAGIEVSQGTMEDKVREMDAGYFHHRTTGMPLVTWKYAMTLDGSVAANDGSSQWITSEDARRDAHGLRAGVDAVVVGAGTLRSDDPLLNVRLDGYQGSDPVPVLIAGSSSLPESARLWEREPLVVATSEIAVPAGRVVVVSGQEGLPDPTETCLALAGEGFLDVLLEGGPTLAGAWWRAGVIGRGVVYVGARVGGGAGRSPLGGLFAQLEDADVVSITGVRSLGGDLRIDFERR